MDSSKDVRLIEVGFPCHQVGAETQRERGASSALPPLYFLHVWWARRPLTPSRAAIVASLDPAGTNPETFIRQLGIERVQALVNEEPWTLTGKLLERIEERDGWEVLPVDGVVLRALERERQRHETNCSLIERLLSNQSGLRADPTLLRWLGENKVISDPEPVVGDDLQIRRIMGDPAWAKERIGFENALKIRTPEDKYQYPRAYTHPVPYTESGLTVLGHPSDGIQLSIPAPSLVITLGGPDLCGTLRIAEAVANPYRDKGPAGAKETYERMMGEIFQECRRVLKDGGIFTLMFNHKSQDAWETLTHSLIDAGWEITACFPVESESGHSTHQMNLAAAASSIFLSCRKRPEKVAGTAIWETTFGQPGVRRLVEESVQQGLADFEPLKLNPVDEMVASYGKALRVLSANWPVQDGDDLVSPIKAMNEASRVVSQSRVSRITKGKVKVEDLDSETAMALTIFGIWECNEIAYDDGLNLSRSLGIALEGKGTWGPQH